MSVCLDAYALLSWLQNEPGADVVERYLQRAIKEASFSCFLSLINLGEVFYRLWRARGVEQAQSFWQAVMRGVIPINPVDATSARIREAACLKGQYPIAYADAFAAQVAMEKRLPLVTGDAEFRSLEEQGLVTIQWLASPAARGR